MKLVTDGTSYLNDGLARQSPFNRYFTDSALRLMIKIDNCAQVINKIIHIYYCNYILTHTAAHKYIILKINNTKINYS